MKTEVIITEKGALMKSNNWKAGEKISCHPNIAEDFIKKGIAVASKSDNPVKENKVQEPVTNNKVQEPRTNDKHSNKKTK